MPYDWYGNMYAEGDEITREQFNELLLAAYRLAMDFYPDGPPRTCLQLYKVLKAVVDSAFHRKDCLPVQYLSNWVSSHCPRLVVGLHRYVVHALTTTYRTLGKDQTDMGPVVVPKYDMANNLVTAGTILPNSAGTSLPGPSQGRNIDTRRKRMRPPSPILENIQEVLRPQPRFLDNVNKGKAREAGGGRFEAKGKGLPRKSARGVFVAARGVASDRARYLWTFFDVEVKRGALEPRGTAIPTGALRKDQRGTADKITVKKASKAITKPSSKDPPTQSLQDKSKPLLKWEVQERLGKARGPKKGLDLSTPVLEREPSFENDDNVMLPLSEVWLLATSLPLLFTKPSEHHSPDNLAAGLTSHNFVTKLGQMFYLNNFYSSITKPCQKSNTEPLVQWAGKLPTELCWTHRFMHHVLSYRGSTLTFLRGEGGVQFCVAASTEWKESHQYWGGDDCVVIQLLPNYQIIQKGAKLLYFNLSIRGYPKGLRAGQDQRAPCLQVDEGFNLVTFCGIPYRINSVEVWGCGSQRDSPKSYYSIGLYTTIMFLNTKCESCFNILMKVYDERNVQLEIKKWQVKQAEKARDIKLTNSEWVDNPDRYLLELAGRPSYSSS
uniref:TLDc domain-containing protein n=1 Tax=Timema genevievae TaxID=629358 RepID=A0A7R9PPL1_TIMGE|nr:unnamed protein product [Timema genevievae]